MAERRLRKVATQPRCQADLIPVLWLIDQPQAALQFGQETRHHLAAFAIHIDLAALSHLEAHAQRGDVVPRWCGIVG